MFSEERLIQSSDCSFQTSFKENSNEDSNTGNWIVTSTRCLNDFRPVRDGGLPLAFCLRSSANFDCMLIDMFSQQLTITNISDLGNTVIQEMKIANILELFYATLVYSKERWMLFRGPDSTGYPRARFFLLNILTGESLPLPDNSRDDLGHNYVFSTSSSSVDYVVHVVRKERNGWTTIYFAHPGDEVWEVFSQENHHSIYCFEYTAVIISGKKVYCFDDGEVIDVFDLVERHWVHVTVLQHAAERYYKFHVMEVDGVGIVKMYPPYADFNMYKFYRLEVNEYEQLAGWVEMSEQELEGRSWFVGWTPPFCVKNRGRESDVYTFTVEPVNTEAGEDFGMNIQLYDLKAGATRNVFPSPMYPAIQLCWVDLGEPPVSTVA